jgi:N-acylglucosamine-6-phosphate 2-epimerase
MDATTLQALLKHQLIVSVQADSAEPLGRPEIVTAMAQSVVLGGAAGLRLADTPDLPTIAAVRAALPDVPVIGITKPSPIPANAASQVYITPTFADVQRVAQAGAHVIAMDATLRPRPDGSDLVGVVLQAKAAYPQCLLMADVDTLVAGQTAAALGFDWVSTTLSGYTEATAERLGDEPDFALLKALVDSVPVPVICEGRIWTPEQMAQAFALGAFAVVVGSAITRPHYVTRRFCQALPVAP